jgi:hypothetical protein
MGIGSTPANQVDEFFQLFHGDFRRLAKSGMNE